MKKLVLAVLAAALFGTVAARLAAQELSLSLSSVPHEVTLDHSKQFWVHSKNVGDKFLIKIYLPERFFDSPTSTFPVIYLTDGDRSFGMASGFVSYQLHRDDVDVILVGIGYGSIELNNEKRQRDYRPWRGENGVVGADLYLSFLEQELFPIIEPEYRIDSSQRTLIGWSFGALFTLDVMLKKPEVFRNYLVHSPRLHYERWSAAELEAEYSQRRQDLPVRLFLSMGGEDERYPPFPDFARTLQQRGYENLRFKWEVFDGKRHDALAQAEGIGRGFEFVYIRRGIDSVLSELIEDRGIEHAVTEYRRLRRTEPDELNFGETALNRLGYHLLSAQKLKEAVEIFKLNVEAYPASFNVYDSLGEAYMLRGDKELASASYRRSLELNVENTNAEAMLERLTEE